MTQKYKELAKLTEKELTEQAMGLKQELAKERAVIASGTRSEKPGKIRTIRRQIARIFTAISAKKVKEARK